MKIKQYSTNDKATLTLKPVLKGDATGNKSAQKLEPGEWILIDTDSNTVLFICVSESWSPIETAKKFRLIASKTRKYWGENPVLETDLPAVQLRAALRGILMSDYNSNPKIKKEDISISLKTTLDPEFIIEHARTEADTQMWAMHLVDLPPNKKTPELLGFYARKSAKDYGFECDVWNDDHILKDKLNALHAVGKGSVNAPVFIISRYRGLPDSEETDLALVGKGITFDTGGVSIKGSTNLHYMKSDMAGAAAMLGTIELAARLKLPLNIAVIVPSAENSVDGKSVLPGEVIESYSGKTIEVIDTDAEGRLVLADGIAWVNENLKPKVIIDMATLTGSSVRALGYEAAALYSSNETLSEMLFQSGLTTGEKLWKMPLWSEYLTYIKSDVADIANLSLKPVAGSIIAAKFLEFFTNEHPAWAHIDMPGMSFVDSPFNSMKSATGYGVQLLADFIDKLSENPQIVPPN